MKHLRCFPVLFAKVTFFGGMYGVWSTCVRMCALACVLGLCWPALAQTATTTTLTVTSGGSAVTTVASGSVVTLTATVVAGSTAVNPGTVNFCDDTAAHCTDIHIVATAQLTSAGTASFKFRPGVGSHSYKAVFVGTKTYAGSLSGMASLTVTPPTGGIPTTTMFAPTGNGYYTLTATVSAFSDTAAPTGTVSFLDVSNGNAVLGTADLGPASRTWPYNGNQIYASAAAGAASADFNGDGIPDLAVTNAENGLVSILLCNGDGTFTATPESPVTNVEPEYIVTGDFNGDGIPDLAVVDEDGHSVSIFIGAGDGTFTQIATYNSDGPALNIAVSDFNRDGHLDLAVTCQASSTVMILLGKGDGTFTQAVSPTTGSGPFGVAVADFNGDGIPDLAVTNTGNGVEGFSGENTVTILLGNGDGTFTPTAVSPAVDGPAGVVAADLNGDGIADLAVVNAGDGNKVSILIGNGNGTFASAQQFPGGDAPEYIAVADFVGNGIADLVVTSGSNTVPQNKLTILLGKGDGTFNAAENPPIMEGGFDSLAVADFNGDGVPDIAVTNLSSSSVSIFLTGWSASAAVTDIALAGTGTYQVDASYPGNSTYGASISRQFPLKEVSPVATLTTPTPGLSTILGASNVAFQWTPGVGVTLYQLTLGTTGAGSSDLFSYTGSATSVTVPAVPANGAIVYARLSSKISGAWQYNDYLYTESTTPVPAVLTTPTPGLSTVLGTSGVTFQWTSGTGVALYQLNLGTTGPGSSDLFALRSSVTSTIVATLPANGKEVYARLYSEINGAWQFNDYLYTESGTPVPAVLTTPVPGLSTVLGSSNVTFQWTAGTDVSLYELTLGTIAPNAHDLYVYKGNATSATVPTVPTNAVTVYATLSSYINGAWQHNSYLYTESGTLVPAVLTSPTPGLGTVLGTSSVNFQWTTGTGVHIYQLNLSTTTPGAGDLYVYKGSATSTTVPSLPANGAIVYARLYSDLNGEWVYDDSVYYKDYLYTESGTSAAAVLTSPTPGLSTVLGTSEVSFEWTPGAGVTDYQLNLSAIAPGGSDLYLYKGTATSATALSLPANGVKVYARLYSKIDGAWQHNDYVYTEQ